MRLRSLATCCLAASVLAGVSAAPAGSADRAVTARDFSFGPRIVAVRPGATVTFHNAGGIHNVAWDDGFPADPPSASQSSWTVTRSFSRAGAHPFYCQVHGARGVHGMAGIVFVTPTGAVPAPAVSRASALGQAAGLRLSFASSQPATIAANLYRRSASGAYAFYGHVGGAAAYGSNVRTVLRAASGRTLTPGRYRVSLRLRSSAGLSIARTLFATVG